MKARSLHRLLLGATAAMAMTAMSYGVAEAWWRTDHTNARGGRTVAESIGTAAAPTVSKTTALGDDVDLSGFGTSRLARSNGTLSWYEVVRRSATTGQVSATFMCRPSSCRELAVPDGSWEYTVRGAIGAAWRGPTSDASDHVVIDTVAPTVQSVESLDASPSSSTTARWRVTFSESVSGFGASSVTLQASGVTGAAISSVTGSGSVYTVTATTGSGDGTLRLDVVDNDIVRDASVGNLLAGSSSPDGSTIGTSYRIDRTAPSATITRVGDALSGSASVHWTVTFTEPVTDPTLASVRVTGSGGVTGASATSVTAIDSSTFDIAASTGSGEGDLSVELLAGAATDLAGNASMAAPSTAAYTIDRTPAEVQAITRGASSPTNHSSVTWTVTFTGPVTGVGTTDFTIATTGTAAGRLASVTGSGTSYQVTVDQVEGDGTIRLDLVDDGSIRDALLRPLGGAGVGNGSATGDSFTIDRVAPTVLSITRNGAPASTTSSASVVLRVTFTEPVTGVSRSTFAVVHTGTSTGATIQSVTSVSTTTYDVTVATGSTEGTIGAEVTADANVVDAVGNALAGAWSSGERYSIDSIAPTVTSIARVTASPTGLRSLQWRATFSEAVTGVAVGRFSLTGTSSTGAVVTAAVSDATGTVWTVTATTSGTDGGLALRLIDDDGIIDLNGNALGGAGIGNGNLTGESYEVDNTAPTASIVSAGDPAHDATTASWNVVLSEQVASITKSSFSLVTSGVSGASLQSLTRTDDTHYVLVVALGSGSGSVRADLAAGAVSDVVGNTNAATTGATITIDRSSPTVSILSPTDASFVGDSFTARGVCTATDGSVTLDFSGVGSPADRLVTCTAGVPDGSWLTTITASEGSFTLAASQTDGAGNTTWTPTVSFTVDSTAPRLTSIVRKTPSTSYATTASVVWTVTFSESVTGLAADDFALSGSAGSSITSVSATSGTTVDVTAATGVDGSFALALATSPTITDRASNSLAVTAATGTTESYTVDRTAPRLTSVVRKTPASALTNGSSVVWTVTFSESVTGLATTDFALSGSTGAAFTSVSANSGTSIDVTASTGTDGTLTLALAATPTIDDTAGNTLTNTSATGTTETSTIDKTAPTVTITTPINGSTQRAVTTLSGTCTTADGTVGLTLSGAGAPSVTSPTCSSGAWSVSTTFASGSYSLTASQTDAAGNSTTTSSVSFTIDAVAPRLASIVRKTPTGSATNGSSVVWTVTFSESVTGLATDDFTLSGSTGATLTSVSAAGGTSIDVTASTGTGGTLTIALAATPTIDDTAGNTLTNTSATGTTETYTIDKTAPTVTLTSPTSGASLAASVTIAGACTTADGSVTVTATGTGAPSIAAVTCTSGAWTTTVTFPSGSFTASASQTDTAGNQGTSGAAVSFTADGVAPTLSSVTLGNGGTSGTADKNDTITIVFSETVVGTKMCSLWTNDTTSTVYTYNGNSDVMVTFTPGSGNTTVTVTSTSCTFNLGTLTLPAYVTGSARTFGGTGNSKSNLSWTPSTRTLVITLGSAGSGSGTVATGITSTTGTYNPPTATQITDTAGNQLMATKSITGTF